MSASLAAASLAAALAAGCGGALASARGAPRGGRLTALPTPLRAGLFTRAQVCADARRRFPEKRLALVALKSHVCDRGAQVCLRLTRDLADRCNAFVRAGFALYHARLYRNSPDGRHEMEELPTAWDIVKAWSSSGPTLFVVDVERCLVLGQVGPGIPGIGSHDGGTPDVPPPERFRLVRDALLAIPGVAERLPPGARGAVADPACLAAPAPDVREVWDALERQAE